MIGTPRRAVRFRLIPEFARPVRRRANPSTFLRHTLDQTPICKRLGTAPPAAWRPGRLAAVELMSHKRPGAASPAA